MRHQDKAVGQKHQGKSKSIGARVLGKGHPDMGFEARAEGHGRRDMVLQVRDIGEGALEQNQWEKGTEHGQRGSLIFFTDFLVYRILCNACIQIRTTCNTTY